MSRRVTVEYTDDVESFSRHPVDGAVTISKGTIRQVDARSAKKLVNAKKAKLVGGTEEKAEARDTLKSVEPGGVA